MVYFAVGVCVCVCVCVRVLGLLHLHCSVHTSLAAVYVGCLVEVHRLSCMWDLSSPTRKGIRVPCIGRQILNHGTTRNSLYF